MIGQDAIARRTSDGLEWIDEIGRRFADATGWPVTFHAAQPPDDDPGPANPETCWASDICNGDDVVGRLQIDLPADPENDRGFLSTCELGELVSLLVSQLVTACERLEQKTNDVGLLLEMGRTAAASERPIRNELQEFLRVAAELTGFWGAAFFLLTPDGRELKFRAAHRLEAAAIPVHRRMLETTPPDIRALTGEDFTICARDGSIYRRWLPADCPLGHCVQVRAPSGPAGVMWLFDRRVREIAADEARTIQSIASQLAGALERVVLLCESAVHHRQNHDLRVASQCLQETGVPLRMTHAGFEMAAVCSNRYELGGDLCDVIPLGDDRLLLAVGDASGDSVPAALVMSAVRGAIRAILGEGRRALPPHELLQRVNHSLHGLSATFQFMSLFLGVLDFRSLELTYSNAGHPFPLLLHGDDIRELNAHGLLLGVLPHIEYHSTTVSVRPGEVFAAYSDGISEATDADEAMFGAEGIRAALISSLRDSAATILKTVQDAFDRHVSGGVGGDDRTFLVLKIAESPDDLDSLRTPRSQDIASFAPGPASLG
ncbi:MAG: PP2C family protein-serine/threonine phosphatase [Planctomycetaceae bacterium]